MNIHGRSMALSPYHRVLGLWRRHVSTPCRLRIITVGECQRSLNMRGRVPGIGFGPWHLGSFLSCIMHTPCARFSKHETSIPPGTRYRVPGPGYLAPGTRTGSAPRAGYRAPKTEPGHRKTRTPSMHPVPCIRFLTRKVNPGIFRIRAGPRTLTDPKLLMVFVSVSIL